MVQCGNAALLTLWIHTVSLQTTHGAVFSSPIKIDFHFNLLTLSSVRMLY